MTMKCPKCHAAYVLEYQDGIYGRPMGRYQCFICDHQWELPRVVKTWRGVRRKVQLWRRGEHETELPF